MRARSASISASGISIVNGRIAVAPAEFSVVPDMWVSRDSLVADAEVAVQDRAWAFRVGRRAADERTISHGQEPYNPPEGWSPGERSGARLLPRPRPPHRRGRQIWNTGPEDGHLWTVLDDLTMPTDPMIRPQHREARPCPPCVPVKRVTYGDSRSLTEQPALSLACAPAGPA